LRPEIQTSSEFFAMVDARPRKKLTLTEVVAFRRELRVHAAYRACFGGGDAPLRPEFGVVLEDLARAAGFDKIGGGCSDADLREAQGAKTMLLHLLNRIDRDAIKTKEIHRLLRESDRD
jgi:hypothetical protein